MATATRTKQQVIYSEIESTVHVKFGDEEVFPDGTKHQAVVSKVILPGEMIGLDEVPDYMLKLVKENKAPGLVLLDKAKAEELNRFAKLARGEVTIADIAGDSSEDVALDSPDAE